MAPLVRDGFFQPAFVVASPPVITSASPLLGRRLSRLLGPDSREHAARKCSPLMRRIVGSRAGFPMPSFSRNRAVQISKLLRFASRHGIPVTPRGAGVLRLRGRVRPLTRRHRAFSRADESHQGNRISADGVAIVETGSHHGRPAGRSSEARAFSYPPDPASLKECSIGGNIATNAGGPRCLKYGVTRSYVLGLEAVLANGDVLRTGARTHKNKTGFDLRWECSSRVRRPPRCRHGSNTPPPAFCLRPERRFPPASKVSARPPRRCRRFFVPDSCLRRWRSPIASPCKRRATIAEPGSSLRGKATSCLNSMASPRA